VSRVGYVHVVCIYIYSCKQLTRATGNSRFEGCKFRVLFWKNPENSRLELTTSKHVHYCQKVGETDSFLSISQNLIVISYKCTFVVTFIAGPLRIPVLKVTNFRSAFGKIPKIPVLELVANKIGDTFLDYRLFVTADLA